MGIEEYIISFFQEFAYQPNIVYMAIIGLMVLSSFGLPIPEEVTLVSTGFLVWIGRNDPNPNGLPTVDLFTAAMVCLLSVFISDYLIYFLGKYFGPKILKLKYFQNHHERLDQVKEWTQKYGFWAAGIFRFTPGIRFPGHFTCGMMGVSSWKFLLVDGCAALLSVPTQVVLVALYGKQIIETFREYTFAFVAFAVIAFVVYTWVTHIKKKKLI